MKESVKELLEQQEKLQENLDNIRPEERAAAEAKLKEL